MVKAKYKKWTNVLLMIVGIIALIGIGGLFINGSFLNVVILKYLPLIVHQVVGWVMIAGAVLSGLFSILK